MPDNKNKIDSFIQRWRAVTGSERANYQLFITGLCELLELPPPEPAHEDTRDNAYVFERRVAFAHGDGSTSNGFIDCYRRGAFVLEAKKVKAGPHTRGFDDALMRARTQAEGYARALPAAELLRADWANVGGLAVPRAAGRAYNPNSGYPSIRCGLAIMLCPMPPSGDKLR